MEDKEQHNDYFKKKKKEFLKKLVQGHSWSLCFKIEKEGLIYTMFYYQTSWKLMYITASNWVWLI